MKKQNKIFIKTLAQRIKVAIKATFERISRATFAFITFGLKIIKSYIMFLKSQFQFFRDDFAGIEYTKIGPPPLFTFVGDELLTESFKLTLKEFRIAFFPCRLRGFKVGEDVQLCYLSCVIPYLVRLKIIKSL